MKKFEVPYKDRVNYPIKLIQYLNDLCSQVGVILGSSDIVNKDYMILGNPFTNGEDCKTVLSNIAQICAGFAKIGYDNKLYIVTLDVSGDTVEEIDGSNYAEFGKNNIFGPVNSIRIQMQDDVDGEESVREEEGVSDTNRCQITISNNYFLNSANEREKVIDNIYNALHELKYLPCNISYYGYPYVVAGAKISVKDSKDLTYETFVLNHTLSFEGAYNGQIESPAMTKTQSAYKNTKSLKEWKRQAEISVDKINGKINQIVQETDEFEEKLTQVEQTVDQIQQQVQDTIVYKREVEGVTEICLEDAGETDILELEIQGNKTYENNLYPGANVFPSENIYPNMEVV